MSGRVSKLSLILWKKFEAYGHKNLGSPQGEAYLGKYTPASGRKFGERILEIEAVRRRIEGGLNSRHNVFKDSNPSLCHPVKRVQSKCRVGSAETALGCTFEHRNATWRSSIGTSIACSVLW